MGDMREINLLLIRYLQCMAKSKHPKERPDKYAEKVAIKTTFEETLKIFAAGANKAVKDKKAATKK